MPMSSHSSDATFSDQSSPEPSRASLNRTRPKDSSPYQNFLFVPIGSSISPASTGTSTISNTLVPASVVEVRQLLRSLRAAPSGSLFADENSNPPENHGRSPRRE